MHNESLTIHYELCANPLCWRRLEAPRRLVMTMSSNEDGFPETLSFQADESTSRKKGAHRPHFASVFTKDATTVKTPKRVHLLVNPYAGKKKGRTRARDAKEILEKAGVEVLIAYSAYSGHLISVAAGLEVKRGDVIAVVGGDGSLSEVITGRLGQETTEKETFAIIPAGTGNSQAHDLGIGSVEEAVKSILGATRQGLDIAEVELVKGLPGNEDGTMTHYSHNLVTWGLGVDSTIQAEKMRWMGPARYDVGILLAIAANKRRTATLTLDGQSVTNDFTLFLVQNSQTGGSMLPLAPGASLDDGWMDIGILKKMTRRDVLKAFGMLKKEGRHVFHPRVDYHRFKSLGIETSVPTAINIDGENIGSTPLSMKVLPQAVNIIVPSE